MSTKEQSAIAEYKQDCDVKELDMISYKNAYEECKNKRCNTPFYQEPLVVWAFGFAAGAFVVYTVGR